ncbi:MAG: PQQ-binding-like beta-propeller repeat protein [candidate division WOR-3 bacterium]
MTKQRWFVILVMAIMAMLPLGCPKNNPPDAPTVPSGITAGMVATTYQFTASAADPDGDSVAVRFDWGDGDTSDWSPFVASGDSVRSSHSWAAAGTYQVKAQAKDPSARLSNWSASHQIQINPEGTLLWRCVVGSSATGSPAVGADGTVYVGSGGKLTAVNPDGTRRWEYQTGGSGGFGSVALAADGTIYASYWVDGLGDQLYAFYPDGSPKWMFPVPSGHGPGCITVGPDSTVYVVAGGNSEFYALRPNGTLKWVFDIGYEVGGDAVPPIGDDGAAYCGGWWSYSLSAVSPYGSEIWSFHIDGGVERGPAIGSDGTIYVGSVANPIGGSQPSYFYAIRPNGSQRWRFLADGHIRVTPAIGTDGTIYFGTQAGTFYALNPNGTIRWSYSAGVRFWASPPVITFGGVICVGSNEGRLLAFNPDGTLRWTYTAGGTIGPLAIGTDGTIYFGSADGYLYAIVGPGTGSADGWPMFQHDAKHTGRVGGGK